MDNRSNDEIKKDLAELTNSMGQAIEERKLFYSFIEAYVGEKKMAEYNSLPDLGQKKAWLDKVIEKHQTFKTTTKELINRFESMEAKLLKGPEYDSKEGK